LTTDAPAALRCFEDLHPKFLGLIGWQLGGVEQHVGNTLYHRAFLLERERARGNMKLHQRRAEVSRNGIGENARRTGQPQKAGDAFSGPFRVGGCREIRL